MVEKPESFEDPKIREYIERKIREDLEKEEKPNLDLKDLESYICTEQYYKVLGVNVTDGIKYIMDNGYAWFVTDALAVIICKPKLRAQPFLAVKLKLTRDEDGKPTSEADLTIEDGNDKIFYRQHYDFTDAKRDLTLFYEYGVLLLDREH